MLTSLQGLSQDRDTKSHRGLLPGCGSHQSSRGNSWDLLALHGRSCAVVSPSCHDQGGMVAMESCHRIPPGFRPHPPRNHKFEGSILLQTLKHWSVSAPQIWHRSVSAPQICLLFLDPESSWPFLQRKLQRPWRRALMEKEGYRWRVSKMYTCTAHIAYRLLYECVSVCDSCSAKWSHSVHTSTLLLNVHRLNTGIGSKARHTCTL